MNKALAFFSPIHVGNVHVSVPVMGTIRPAGIAPGGAVVFAEDGQQTTTQPAPSPAPVNVELGVGTYVAAGIGAALGGAVSGAIVGAVAGWIMGCKKE